MVNFSWNQNHKTSAGATLHCWRTVLQFYYLDNKRFTSDSCYKKPKIGHQTCQNWLNFISMYLFHQFYSDLYVVIFYYFVRSCLFMIIRMLFILLYKDNGLQIHVINVLFFLTQDKNFYFLICFYLKSGY